MTLRKCTVTQLDDTFWRVDWEGKQACFRVDGIPVEGWSWRSPMVVAEDPPGSWRPHGFDAICCRSLDSLLSSFGLTRHDPKPETAEARVRAFAEAAPNYHSMHSETGDATHGDLRAVLAELDRLRDAYDAQSADLLRECRLSDDLKSALRMPGHGSYVAYAKEVRAEIDRLRAQRQVDVDAVLAPVRMVLAHCESRVSFHDKERDAMVLRGLFGDAHWHDAGHSQASTIANKLSVAIAEAEKVAGKEPEHR